MADTKITGLTNFDSSNTPYWPPAPASDVIPIVDISDATMAASGTTKKISINNLLSSSPTATGALTVTGLVTAGSATITGAATVGTTLGVTGVSTLASANVTNNLGVGGNVNYTGAGEFYLQNSASTNFVGINAASNYIRFATNNTIKASLDSSGNFNVQSGNVVMGTSGKGIDFTAAGNAAGMTSELLNDYEDGTFTPTIVGTTTAGVGVYSSQNAKYTKVGNLVTCYIYLAWTAHTGTGDMRIGGLPFATASISGVYYAASIGFATNIALTAGYVMTGYALDNSSALINLHQYPTGGGTSIGIPIDVSAGIIVSISYAT